MTTAPEKQTAATNAPWPWRLAGLIPTGGSGLPASNDGPIEVIVMAILGGFIGLLLGFMAAQVSRFLSMFVGVSAGRPSWGAYGAIVGALAFTLIALVGGG